MDKPFKKTGTISREQQFFAEFEEIRLSPEFSTADLLVYLNQIVDEMYYMAFFQGAPDDYAFLFAVTPVFIREVRNFARDLHDIHFSSLGSHAEHYLQAFESATDEQKLAAIEVLEMQLVGYYEIPVFVEPFMTQQYPQVCSYFSGFFENTPRRC